MKGVRQSFPCFASVDLLTQGAGYEIDYISGDACKVVSDFSGSIGYYCSLVFVSRFCCCCLKSL